MSQQQQLFKIMLFSFETHLNLSQLTIIANSLLFESLNNSLIRGLDGLRLIVLDHDFVESVLEDSDVSHQWALLDESEFV